ASRRRSSSGRRATSPCCCSPAAPPARPGRRCSPTGTSPATSARSWPTRGGPATSRRSCSPCCRCSTCSASTRCWASPCRSEARPCSSSASTPGPRWRRSGATASRSSPACPRCGRRGRTSRARRPTPSPPCAWRSRGPRRSTRPSGAAVRERYGLEVAEGYGLTEASPVVTTGLGIDAPDGSIGVPLPGVSERLGDNAGEDAPVGDPGEIWVRGPNVFPGYWQDEEATRSVLTEDGWLRTGDVAVVDDDGRLFLVDRVKDVIVVSGFNVYPAEVEEVLAEHPAVAAAAVVGVPHPHTGEAVRALVVPADGASVDVDDLLDHAAHHLARYKCPSTVEVVDELPTTLTGKVVRRTLR